MWMKTNDRMTICPMQNAIFLPSGMSFYRELRVFCRNRRLFCHFLHH